MQLKICEDTIISFLMIISWAPNDIIVNQSMVYRTQTGIQENLINIRIIRNSIARYVRMLPYSSFQRQNEKRPTLVAWHGEWKKQISILIKISFAHTRNIHYVNWWAHWGIFWRIAMSVDGIHSMEIVLLHIPMEYIERVQWHKHANRDMRVSRKLYCSHIENAQQIDQ